MALTRKLLAALGIDDAKVDQIIEAHTETVEALKQQRDSYKADADKVKDLETQLEDAKANASAGGGFKDKYTKEHEAFEAFKKQIEADKAHDAKVAAVRTYLKGKGIGDGSLGLAIKALGDGVDGLELDGDTIKDAKALDDALAGDLKPLVTTTTTQGATTATPPANDGNVASDNIFGADGTYFF